jgi:CRISPR-associated endonuclease/helicase Cas3
MGAEFVEVTELFSHKNKQTGERKKLKDHLDEVYNLSRLFLQNIEFLNKKKVLSIAGLVCLSHDFGKTTTFFQDYLDEKLTRDKDGLEKHGLASALFTYYILTKYFSEETDGADKDYFSLLGYSAVLHHHGDLASFDSDKKKIEELKEKLYEIEHWFKDLLSSPRKDAVENLYNSLLKEKGYNLRIDLKEFRNLFLAPDSRINKDTTDKISKQFRVFEMTEKEQHLTQFYLIYSSLIDADKFSAAGIGEKWNIDKRRNLPGDLVDCYINNDFKKRINPDELSDNQIALNKIRDEVYNKVTSGISKTDIRKNKIFTITSPTGSGKTFTGFSAALKLRTRIQNEVGYTPRIIYSLPFTSIIDQNHEVMENLLKFGINDFSGNDSLYLLKHHHLADMQYKENQEEYNFVESEHLITTWNSEIVVTTFIQLLHSVIAFKNSFLRKYHNIANSILLLDEVQNIPVEYWKLVGNMLKMLAEELNCCIILMTATKPLIFDENDYVELLTDSQLIFKHPVFNRTKLIPLINNEVEKEYPETLDEFKIYLKNNLNPDKSTLIVMNTIDSSLSIHNYLQEELQKEGEMQKIFYLSTNIIPKHRSDRIEKIKDAMEKNRVIVVTTQVVEAGVDLDFHEVYRDLGPIDAIIQVAGRCNRNNKQDNAAPVYITYLKNDNDKHFCELVYKSTIAQLSKEILASETEEKCYYELVNEYFNKTCKYKNIGDSKAIWDGLTNSFMFFCKEEGKSSKPASAFRLINDNNNYREIFVEIDDKASHALEKFGNLIKETDINKKRELLLEIKKDFSGNIVSVPAKYVSFSDNPSFHISEDLLIVRRDRIKDYYDENTGFIREVSDNDPTTFVF